jgi:hypothetical protein
MQSLKGRGGMDLDCLKRDKLSMIPAERNQLAEDPSQVAQ